MTAQNKNFKFVVVLNYKSGKIRVVKKASKSLPSEILINLDLDVVIPEQPVMEAKGKIELSSPKIKQLVLESLDA